ncbi:cupin domain-containing protein [Streptomyces sp. NPDC006482]|uniref:cupin domain-containing protein n=1 Tax=Streptomyces sp. NPDC006482 TaxID=3154306 RepID=UPI0033BE9BC0
MKFSTKGGVRAHTRRIRSRPRRPDAQDGGGRRHHSHTLQEGAGGEPSVMLVEFVPDATFGEELHHKKEVLYVLDSEFHDGERAHLAGTLITVKEGSTHWPQPNPGCRVLVLYPDGADT